MTNETLLEETAAAVCRVMAGETEQLWPLLEPHQQGLRVVAYALLRNPDDAGEVVQETMLKALSRLHQLREVTCFKGWLMSIAVNEARMRRRRERGAGRCETGPAEGECAPRDYADWRDIPSNALEQREVWEAVRQALHSISPRAREVFVLRDLQHLSVAETAETLGITEATVSLRLHRARLQMRELLAPLFREPSLGWVPLQMVANLSPRLLHRKVSRRAAVEELSRYVEGELSPRERARLEAALGDSLRCKILLDPARDMLYLVSDGRALHPPFTCSRDRKRAFRGVSKPAFRSPPS